MPITLEQYESIQNYLDGKMTPQEEKDFLIQLENNISLKENFELEKEVKQNLSSILNKKYLFEKENANNEMGKGFKDNDFIKNLIKKAGAEWEEENKEILHPVGENSIGITHRQRKPKVVGLKSWILLAAAACIIIAIINIVWFIQKPSSPELVKSNEKPVIKRDSITNTTETISNDSLKNINSPTKKINSLALFKKYYAKDTGNPEMPGLLAMIPEKYKNGDYSFREINLDKVPITRGSSNDINSRQNILQSGHYYYGLSYIETGDDKKAIENFQWVIKNGNNKKIKIKTQWYLALVYLKNNENEKAAPLLFTISQNASAKPYNKESGDILKKIEVQEEQQK